MTDQATKTGVAVGIGAFLGSALAEQLETPSTTTGGTIDLTPVTDALNLLNGQLVQLLALDNMILAAIQNLAGSSSTTGDLTTLQAIQADLDLIIQPAKVIPNIDVISTATGGTLQQLYITPKLVRKAIIQNISQDPITVFAVGTSNGVRGVNSQGIILNAASGAGSGGGTLPTNNIDLSSFWFSAATTGDKLAVYTEY